MYTPDYRCSLSLPSHLPIEKNHCLEFATII
jgi:hypothetical protein